jgi:colicin import membrane protein
MQAEEHLDAARSNGALAQYQAMIAARIERAWIRPPSAHPGINCQVHITQVPGGVVTGVQVGNCNGDEAVRQSISDAAYRASPLPAPPDPALFDRDVIVTFAPHD